MKWIAFAAMVWCCAFNVRAGEAFVEAGVCDFNQSKNGDFWQDGRYTKNALKTECVALGVQGKFTRLVGPSPNWGWRVGIMWTSSWQHRSNVASYYDDEIGKVPHEQDCDTEGRPGDPAPGRGCYTVHSGSGNLRGIFVGLTHESDLGGGWKLIPEVGLLFYRMKQDNSVTWLDPADCPPYHPGNYNAGENKDLLKMPSAYFGVTVRYKSVYAYARHYESQGGHPLALTDGTFTQYGVGAVVAKW